MYLSHFHGSLRPLQCLIMCIMSIWFTRAMGELTISHPVAVISDEGSKKTETSQQELNSPLPKHETAGKETSSVDQLSAEKPDESEGDHWSEPVFWDDKDDDKKPEDIESTPVKTPKHTPLINHNPRFTYMISINGGLQKLQGTSKDKIGVNVASPEAFSWGLAGFSGGVGFNFTPRVNLQILVNLAAHPHLFETYELRVYSSLLGLKMDLELNDYSWMSAFAGGAILAPKVSYVSDQVRFRKALYEDLEETRSGWGAGLQLGRLISHGRRRDGVRRGFMVLLGWEWLKVREASSNRVSLGLGFRWR